MRPYFLSTRKSLAAVAASSYDRALSCVLYDMHWAVFDYGVFFFLLCLLIIDDALSVQLAFSLIVIHIFFKNWE